MLSSSVTSCKGGGIFSTAHAQCARGAVVWVSVLTKNPYFVILGTSLLFDNLFLILRHWRYGMFGFSPKSTHFHPFSPFSTFFLAHFSRMFSFLG